MPQEDYHKLHKATETEIDVNLGIVVYFNPIIMLYKENNNSVNIISINQTRCKQITVSTY